MVTEKDNTQSKISVETNSERYGNETSVEDVFDDPFYPKPPELEQALVAPGHLTEKEAFAFVHGHFEGFPHVSLTTDAADEMVQNQGFDSASDFVAVKKEATRKIADAIWIYELIDAYRFPDFPEECEECGDIIDGVWARNPDDEEATVRCLDCADVDPDWRSPPYPTGWYDDE